MIESQRKSIRALAETWVGFPERGLDPDSTDPHDPRGYLKRRYGIHDPHTQDAWLHKGTEPEEIDNDFEHPDARHLEVDYRKRVSATRLHLQHVYRMAQLDRFMESLEALAKPRSCFASTLRDLVSWLVTGADVFGLVNQIFKNYEYIERKIQSTATRNTLHFGAAGQSALSGWRSATAEAYRIFDSIEFEENDDEGAGQRRTLRALARCADEIASALSNIGRLSPQGFEGVGPDFLAMAENFYMFGREIERAGEA